MMEGVAAVLLLLSGGFVLISAFGFARPSDFFVRMHPPALAYTLGSWSVALAGILVYSSGGQGPALRQVLLIILLFMTVPVTSLLLARVALFRRRSAGAADTPPPLTSQSGPASQAP